MPDLPVPPGLSLTSTAPGEYTITKKWREWGTPHYLFLLTIANGVVYYFSLRDLDFADFRWMNLMDLTLPTAVIGLNYYILAAVFNKVILHVSPSGVWLRSAPLPCMDRADIDIRNLTDLRIRPTANSRTGANRHSRLLSVDQYGNEKKLLSLVEQPDHAEFLAIFIKEKLNLSGYPASIPEGLELGTTATGKVIRWKWMKWSVLPLIPFAIMADYLALKLLFSGGTVMHWLYWVFLLFIVLTGSFLTYYCASVLLNRSVLEITSFGVRLGHQPLRWREKIVTAGDIHELRSKLVRTVVRNKNGGEQERISFSVVYVNPAGREQTIADGFKLPEQADFIVETIRGTLQLPKE